MDYFETYISEFCAWARQRPRKERELKEDWVNDYHIDTCAVDDREWSYETAIECKWFNGGNWVIVRGYETKEDAEVGHSTWCNKAKTGFNKLYDVYEDRIYCKEKAENLKPIETISHTKRCRFVLYVTQKLTFLARYVISKPLMFVARCAKRLLSLPSARLRTIHILLVCEKNWLV